MDHTVILSDIHSNKAALQAVIRHAYEHHAPSQVWILGDVVGYGPEPFETWRELKNLPVAEAGWLAGNHEWGLFERLSGPLALLDPAYEVGDIRGPAWEVLVHQKKILSDIAPATLQYLSLLPVMSSPQAGVFLAHGEFSSDPHKAVSRYTRVPSGNSPASLRDTFYLARQANPHQALQLHTDNGLPPRLFAVGHSHLPGFWRWDPDVSDWKTEPVDGKHILGDLGLRPIFLNPGSVGFPRTGDCCPSYVVIDWEHNWLKFCHVNYDVEYTREKMRKSEVFRSLLRENGFMGTPRCASSPD